MPRVLRPARPGGVATEATRGRRSAWLGSGRSGPRRAALTLTATPTGEDGRKVCEEVGGTGRTARPGARSLCAPLGVGSPPGRVGARCPRGAPEPRRAPAHAVWPARDAAQWPPQLTPRPSAVLRMPGSPTEATLPDPTPRQPRQSAGAPAAGRRARRAALEQSCREAGGAPPRAPPRTLPGALARSPRRARATAARSPARSPPPLVPRAHNEAAGREVVPAAASAPLPQPMPPPAEHLALGWEGGPGGRGLGPGLDLQGVGSGPEWGARTPSREHPWCLSSQTWLRWVDPIAPQEKPGVSPTHKHTGSTH